MDIEKLVEGDEVRFVNLMVAARGPKAASAFINLSSSDPLFPVKDKLKKSNREDWAAKDGSIDAGIISSTVSGNAVTVNVLFVKEEYRGQGTGQKLLERAEKWADELGKAMIKTSVDREIEDPEKVITWLQGRGYRIVSEDEQDVNLQKKNPLV
ncbi:MAG: GNAT family N-acetyltransferase [Bacteroidetes bacterium]|nr:GNAT family N-acetyltransferase [Bacteroidota bacterium]